LEMRVITNIPAFVAKCGPSPIFRIDWKCRSSPIFPSGE
jgi:hypothetical protein